MELELAVGLVRHWLARPWVMTAWAVLVALTGLIPTASGVSIRAEAIGQQAVMSETILLWGLAGGLSTLGAWAEWESLIRGLAGHRQWRVRAWMAIILIWLPAIPIFALGGAFNESVEGRAMLVPLAVLAQLTATVWVADRIPWSGARSFLFLALAWWLPALATGWISGPAGWVEWSENGLADSSSGSDSPVWIAWAGSMLGLLFATLGLDLLRCPHHEVRNPR
jgi:hypothetical protein